MNKRDTIPCKRNRKGQKGFTLIEAFVVIATLSIVVTFVVSNLMGKIESANTQQTTHEIPASESTHKPSPANLKNLKVHKARIIYSL